MDSYTENTKVWLEQRFLSCDERRMYIAHQPIYGFRKGISEPGLVGRYTISYQILKILSQLKFSSLLDVGGAEGYKAALVQDIFRVEVCNSDLSEEACKRAREIFGIRSDSIDIHNLPYKDEEFDVVLCSETIEHVSNIKKATSELLRVAKKAVIITVPHESQKIIDKNIKENIPHAHIHSFDTKSFDYVKVLGYDLMVKKHSHKSLKIAGILIEGIQRKGLKNFPKILIKFYNIYAKTASYVFGKNSFSFIINLDNFLCNDICLRYNGLCFVIIKDKSAYSNGKNIKINVKQMLNFGVPFYYL